MLITYKKSKYELFKKYVDIKLIFIVLALIFIGLFSLYSSSISLDTSHNLFNRQFLSTCIGLAAMVIVSLLPEDWIKRGSVIFYWLSIVLLLAVLFFGVEIYGTKGWIRFAGLSFQPAELAKITTILIVARHLAKRGANVSNIWDFSIISGYFLLPFVIINLQPDFGTSLVIFIIFLGVLYWGGFDGFILFILVASGIIAIAALKSNILFYILFIVASATLLLFQKKIYYYLIGVGLLLAVGLSSPVIYNNLAAHQKSRIDVFLNPGHDPQGVGYNVMQSVLAVGSGGYLGKGYMQGTLTQLRYIPMQWTDFIFSVPAEEFGLLGSLVIILFLCALVWRCGVISSDSKNKFYSTLAFGAAVMFLFHIFVNIGMVIGIVPVMGIPLPFMSYGGTSMIMNLILIGLLLNAHRHNNTRENN